MRTVGEWEFPSTFTWVHGNFVIHWNLCPFGYFRINMKWKSGGWRADMDKLNRCVIEPMFRHLWCVNYGIKKLFTLSEVNHIACWLPFWTTHHRIKSIKVVGVSTGKGGGEYYDILRTTYYIVPFVQEHLSWTDILWSFLLFNAP